MDANEHKFKSPNNVMPDLIRHPGRIFLFFILGHCLIFQNGCIIPFPHFKETCGPICGYVVSEDPNIPIENALVEAYYPDEGRRKTYTDESGYFAFPQKNRFYWGILFGVALNHSLPLDCHVHGSTTLNIEMAGYDKRDVYVDWHGIHKAYADDPNDLHLEYLEMAECPRISIDKAFKENYIHPDNETMIKQ